MGSMPLPALDIKAPPQQPGPLQQYATLQQLMGGQQEQQLRSVQIQQAQQAQADNKAMTTAMQQWDGQDYTKLPSLVLKNGGSANAVFAATQHILNVRQQTSEIAKNDAATGASTLEQAIKTNDQYRGRIQAVIGAPADQKAQLWDSEITAEEQAGKIKPGSISHIYPGDDAATVFANHFALGSVLAKEATEKTTAQARQTEANVALAEQPSKIAEQTAGAARSQAQVPVEQATAKHLRAETANMATPAQAAAQRAAQLTETQNLGTETGEKVKQLQQQQASISQPDVTGFQSKLPVAEYNKRYDAFSKSKQFGQVQTLQGSYSQFKSTLDDLDAGKPMSGAASVVSLFNAIGISAEPLAGKGFRINNNTVQEHVGARGLDQAGYQKLLSLKNGDVITPQQVRDYAGIAANVYKQAYVSMADEAHRQGLPADFLPQGGGTKLDGTTAEIFARTVLHANPGLANSPQELRRAVAQAAQKSGWDVQ